MVETFSLSSFGVEKVELSSELEAVVLLSVNDFFANNDREVNEIWDLTAYKCDDITECDYFVDSYADAQIGYTNNYGTHECSTLVKEVTGQLQDIATVCEYVE